MTSYLTEIQACISSLEDMLERAKKLHVEYEKVIRPYLTSGSPRDAPDVSTLKYAISFVELRSLDLMCKDSLQRCLPNNRELLDRWFTYDTTGMSGAQDVVNDLLNKRMILKQALSLLQNYDQSAIDNKHRPLSEGYSKLTEPIHRFLSDSVNHCDEYENNVFIMTRFLPGNKPLQTINDTVRNTLKDLGLNGHRADDRCYPNDRNLWDNVCTYMICCKFGIAILEDLIQDEFNPNVALEYGFMRALGKPTLLLKEKRFKSRADILGTLWEEFDILDIEASIPIAIQRWAKDIR